MGLRTDRANIEKNIAHCDIKIAEAKQRIGMAEASGENVKALKERQKGFEKAKKDYQTHLPKK